MSMIASSDAVDPGDEGAPVPTNAVPHGLSAEQQPEPSRNRRSRWPLALVSGGLVLAAGVYALTRTGGDDTDAEPVTIRAVTAEQRDLVEFTDLDGTLGYARSRSIQAAATGTITSIVDDGETVARGDAVYELDAEPVVVFYGDTPLYRPLVEGDDGDDVELLEANLASLGYHLDQDADDLVDGEDEIDTGFTVDGDFDAATTEAVLRWQEDLGRAETGGLSPGDVVVTDGPSVSSNLLVEVGSVVQAGAPILDLNFTGTVEAFYSADEGEVEFEADTGSVTSGQVLYVVDGRPVTAVVTEETFTRDLSNGVEDGDDVRALEEMLVGLGHDARGDLEPDDEFDDITAEAVESWQGDLQDTWDDVVVDGTVTAADVVVVEPGTTVGSITDQSLLGGKVVATGSELFTWSAGDGRVVTTAIDVAEQDKLAEGIEVEVQFPDGTIVVGTVTEVATSSTVDPTDPDGAARLAVEITLPGVPDSAAELNELDVEIKLVENVAVGVTVVPASALAATSDGGFAVEVVEGTTTSFVPVVPGMFADGFVEVDGIGPGTAVVVPS